MAGDGDEQRANAGANHSGGRGDETTECEREIVTRRDTMLQAITSMNSWSGSVKGPHPDRADSKSHHTAHESRFGSLLGDPLIDTLSQPNVRLHVPRIE